MDNEINSSLDTAKRSCNRCFSQQNFKPSIENKEIAVKATKNATEVLRNKFDELRKKDAPVEEIESAKAGKTLCLDATDACANCNKERPRIKEILLDIPQ